MIIAVDFDGTIADHRFPDIGDDVPGAFRWLREFASRDAKLILWTIRSDHKDGPTLTDAVKFCRANGVEFWGINENPTQKTWSQSPKAYAHIFIDDAAFGCPLRDNPRTGGRPYADWDKIGPSVIAMIEAEFQQKVTT